MAIVAQECDVADGFLIFVQNLLYLFLSNQISFQISFKELYYCFTFTGINECRGFQDRSLIIECRVCLTLTDNLGLPSKCCDFYCQLPFVPYS